MQIKVKNRFWSILILVSLFFSCNQKPAQNKAYYFNMGKQYFAQNKYENAIESFKKVVNDFPGKNYKAESLFFLGYIYANNLRDKQNSLELAKKYYSMFEKEFPTHQLIESVRAELKNLGKSPEEIIFPMSGDSLK